MQTLAFDFLPAIQLDHDPNTLIGASSVDAAGPMGDSALCVWLCLAIVFAWLNIQPREKRGKPTN
jgi:hypothetical protein